MRSSKSKKEVTPQQLLAVSGYASDDDALALADTVLTYLETGGFRVVCGRRKLRLLELSSDSTVYGPSYDMEGLLGLAKELADAFLEHLLKVRTYQKAYSLEWERTQRSIRKIRGDLDILQSTGCLVKMQTSVA